MQQHAPTFLEILLAATAIRCPRPNRDAVISMCSAMVCKLHRPQMSAAQKTLSLILYAGHASKKVCHTWSLTSQFIYLCTVDSYSVDCISWVWCVTCFNHLFHGWTRCWQWQINTSVVQGTTWKFTGKDTPILLHCMFIIVIATIVAQLAPSHIMTRFFT